MNILVLGWRDPRHPNAGGAEQVVHEHCKGWIEGGHTVTLYSSFFAGAKKYEVIDGVEIIRDGIQFGGVQLSSFWWYLFGKHKVFDIVVDQFHGIPFFTPFYVKKPKLAIIQEVAGKVWMKNELPAPFNWIIGFIGYITEPLIFLFYKNIPFMTGSDSARRDLIRMGIPAKNVTIINHGVKVTYSKNDTPKEKITTIMYLGSVTKDKGISDVLQTFYFLSQKGRFQFWIVGKASEYYQKFLKEKVKEYGISKSFKYFGFVDEKTKFNLLSRAHVLINPSILEGWGLVNIEANMCGMPVVAYNSPGLIDSVKDRYSGLIVKENNPKTMAEVINNLVNDKNLYEKLSMSARKWGNKFNWESSKTHSIKLIEKISGK